MTIKNSAFGHFSRSEVIWKQIYYIYAKFLRIFVKFQNTGKALLKFNKNRDRKKEVVV